jgi:hypothetical protein
MMYVRMPTFEVVPDKIEASIHYFQETSLPQLQKLTGFEGATMLVDRDKGIVRILTYYISREALESSTEVAKRLRAEFVESHEGAKVVSVEAYEVAVQVGLA